MGNVILRKKARFIVAAITVVTMLFTVVGINGISEANADTASHTYTKDGLGSVTVTGDYIAGQGLTIDAVGYNQNGADKGNHMCIPDEAYLTGPYNYSEAGEKFKLGAPGEYRLDVEYAVCDWISEGDEEFGDGYWDWVYTDAISEKISVKGKVIFNPAGGKVTNKTRYRYVQEAVGTLPKATWSNHKFKGWYTKKTKGTKISATTKVVFGNNISKTYYAQWIQKVKVVFNANKGKVSKKYKKVWAGNKYGSLPKAKRSGYTFKGWYTKKSGGKKVTSKTKAPDKAKVTLYAHWKKK